MNGKEILDYYRAYGEIVVNFKTKDGFIDFLKFINNTSFRWITGEEPDTEYKYSRWDSRGDVFCLRLKNRELRIGKVETYKEWSYPIKVVEYNSKKGNINNW